MSDAIAPNVASDLEKRFFWWRHVGTEPRTRERIVAQAMDMASFEEARQLEATLGPECLVEVMLQAEPGWISDRSWEF